MRATRAIQDIDLWEVWIDYDPADPNFFGTLYIIGEVWSGQTAVNLTLLREESGRDGVLELRLPERTGGRLSPVEVHYSEPIRNLNQYHAVRIFSGSELLLSVDEIEVLI